MRRAVLLVVVATLVGLALRLDALTEGVLSLDESYTIVEAQASVADIFRLAATDPNPPATSLVYKLWTSLFGTSELAWELLAVVLGTVSIPLIAWLGARALGPGTGAVAAWLLATAPTHVAFSQQVRSYAFAIALSLLACLALLLDLERPGSRRALAFLGAAWLLLNTHYYGFLLVLAWSCGALASQNVGRAIRLSLLVVAVSLPTLPWLYLQYTRYRSFVWIPKPEGRLLVRVVHDLAGDPALIVVLLALAALGATAALRGGQRNAAAVLLAWLLVPGLAASGASVWGQPFLHPRYGVLWLAPLLLLAAHGIASLPWLAGRVAVVTLALLLAVTPLRSYYDGRRAQAAFKHELLSIGPRFQPGDVVLHLSKATYVPSLFYTRGREQYLLAGMPSSNVMRYWMPAPTELALADLGRYRRVFVVASPEEPAGASEMVLRSRAFRALAPRPIEGEVGQSVRLYELTSAPSRMIPSTALLHDRDLAIADRILVLEGVCVGTEGQVAEGAPEEEAAGRVAKRIAVGRNALPRSPAAQGRGRSRESQDEGRGGEAELVEVTREEGNVAGARAEVGVEQVQVHHEPSEEGMRWIRRQQSLIRPGVRFELDAERRHVDAAELIADRVHEREGRAVRDERTPAPSHSLPGRDDFDRPWAREGRQRTGDLDDARRIRRPHRLRRHVVHGAVRHRGQRTNVGAHET